MYLLVIRITYGLPKIIQLNANSILERVDIGFYQIPDLGKLANRILHSCPTGTVFLNQRTAQIFDLCADTIKYIQRIIFDRSELGLQTITQGVKTWTKICRKSIAKGIKLNDDLLQCIDAIIF